MSNRLFFVRAHWDENAQVYYSESDIDGLQIEAASIEEFEEVMFDVAVELILANHYDAPRLASASLKELVPAIIWQRPERASA